jgi:alkaline phosphatase D
LFVRSFLLITRSTGRRSTAALAVLALLVFAPTAFAEGKAPRRIVFGSCVHQDKPQPIWSAIGQVHPDLFIFGGDNIYGDTKDMKVLRQKYDKLAAQPGYQKIKQSCPIVATWDDHDYGKNDAGADWPFRDEAQQIFLDFFGFPKESPLRTQKGVYHSHVFGPPDQAVQVILLDTRYHRSPLQKKPGKFIRDVGPYQASTDKTATMLGEEQWAWLAGELKKPARLRLLVSSIQVLSDDHGWEKWGNFPLERERLLQLLASSKAEGLIILSGDRHHAELSVADIGLGYPLFDLTSSGLNQGFEKWRFPEPNRHRVSTMFHGNNFAALLIDWDQPDPTIRLQIRDEGGEIMLQERLPLSVLQAGSLKSKAAPAAARVVTINEAKFDPATVKDLADKQVSVLMYVAGTGASKTAGFVFLNSSSDRKSPDNFTIVLDKKAQDGLKETGIAQPRTHFEGKTIRVDGTLSFFQDQPQIMLSDSAKIRVVE